MQNPVLPTNHLAATIKPNLTATELQHKNLYNSHKLTVNRYMKPTQMQLEPHSGAFTQSGQVMDPAYTTAPGGCMARH